MIALSQAAVGFASNALASKTLASKTLASKTLGRRRRASIFAMAAVAGLLSVESANAQCTGVFNTAGGGIPFDLTATTLGAVNSVNSLVSIINTINTGFLTQTSAFVAAPGNAPASSGGGGVWVRGIGGRVDTKATGTLTINADPIFFPGGGSGSCDTKTRLEFAGYQIGADISRLNIGESNLHIGVTAGYAEGDGRDATPGGTGRTRSQVPFFGLYAVFTHGNFFADSQLRWDFYRNRLTDPANGVLGQQLDAEGVSLTVNFGYQFELPNNWFIEPTGGVIWSRVSVNPLNLPGTLLVGGFAPPGTIQVGDIDGALARASLRVGTNIVTDTMLWQPFATASILHEFGRSVSTSFTSCISTLLVLGAGCGTVVTEAGATLSTSRIGTYGQFGVGVAAQLLGGGTLGYLRLDYRAGKNIDGISVNAGLRHHFTPGADAGNASAPVDWNGLYVGGFLGALRSDTPVSLVGIGVLARPELSGPLVGGTLGFNVQTGDWVFGVEGDMAWTKARAGTSCDIAGVGPFAQFFLSCEGRANWLATATGRVGHTWGRGLVYLKGGGAWMRAEGDFIDNTTGLSFESFRTTMAGWTIGAGVEYALNANWSARAEYGYYDFGLERVVASAGDVLDIGTRMSTVKVGVNYRFGGALFGSPQ